MAIYHMSIKNISRAKGKTAIAAAAYRAGTILTDQETGITHSYTQKTEVAYTEIILPEHAPEEYANREILWNEVQKVETQDRARLAREWEVALPNELDLDQAKTLIHDFAGSLVKEGMCVDVSIHWKDGNHHAHIMGTTRPIDKDGKWAPKERKGYKLDAEGNKIPVIDTKTGKQKIGARGRKMWQRETIQANDWNRREKVEEWRKRWADCCNKYLSQERRIDHRSYERQGVTQLPTVHEGYAARLMEQRGTVSDLCQRNRDIRLYNQVVVLYRKSTRELKLLEQEIAKEPDFRELRMDGCRLAEELLHKYGNKWAEKRAQEEFEKETQYRQSYIDMFTQEIKETEEKYKKKALKERGLFAKMLGSDGMTDKIKEEMADATRYLRRRLAEERQALPSIPDTDSYNRYWYNIYKSNDADRKMTFAMHICEKIGVQNDQDQDYLQLKKVYDKFEPINRKIEQKKRRQELAQYNANYRNRSSRDNQYTID